MRTALTGVLVVGLAVPTAQAGSAVTWQDILADQRTIGDVVIYGLGPQGQGYSPLDRIDRVNVAALVAAWAFSFRGRKTARQEAQPLVHDGTIFVAASYWRIFAVDARSSRANHHLRSPGLPHTAAAGLALRKIAATGPPAIIETQMRLPGRHRETQAHQICRSMTDEGSKPAWSEWSVAVRA